MQFFYQKLWDMTKQYWWVLLVAAAASSAGFFVAKSIYSIATPTAPDNTKVLKDAYEQKIKALEDSSAEEARQHEEIVRQLEDDLAESQRRYVEAKAALEINKRKIYDDVLRKYNDDPTSLAQKFSEISGIKVQPTESKQ